MLELRQVSVSRPGGAAGRRMVLDGLSLQVEAATLTAFIGPSGGGKTTLLRLLNRLDDPDRGEVRLAGVPLTELPPVELRRRVALVPQRPVMFDGTVWGNLCLPWKFRQQPPPAPDNATVRQALALALADPEWLPRPARDLSGGQQQRVALARTLLTDPELLLLDEPTSALDRRTARQLLTGLRQWLGGTRRTVLMVTHDLELAALADRVLFLEGGRLVEDGPATQLLRQPQTAALQRFLANPESWEEVRA